jgi:hypothetical protein
MTTAVATLRFAPVACGTNEVQVESADEARTKLPEEGPVRIDRRADRLPPLTIITCRYALPITPDAEGRGARASSRCTTQA